MPKVPGSPPHLREQDPQALASARVIVWSHCSSPCPQKARQKARRWEDRLARLDIGPVATLTCPRALRRAIERSERHPPPDQPPLVLIDCEEPSPAVQKLERGASTLPEQVWEVVASHPTVAVVPNLTWQEAGPWLLCGAQGVVAWQSADEDLRCVLEAVRDSSWPQLHEALQRTLGGSGTSGHKHAHDLSPREREVLPLLCQGLSNADIGRCLFVSEDDVRHHLKNLYRKLGTHNRVQVLLISLSNNWVSLHDLLERLG